MPCPIQTVVQRKRVAEPPGAHPVCKIESCKTTQEMRMRSTNENFQFFVMYRSPANFYFSFFPAETL